MEWIHLYISKAAGGAVEDIHLEVQCQLCNSYNIHEIPLNPPTTAALNASQLGRRCCAFCPNQYSLTAAKNQNYIYKSAPSAEMISISIMSPYTIEVQCLYCRGKNSHTFAPTSETDDETIIDFQKLGTRECQYCHQFYRIVAGRI